MVFLLKSYQQLLYDLKYLLANLLQKKPSHDLISTLLLHCKHKLYQLITLLLQEEKLQERIKRKTLKSLLKMRTIHQSYIMNRSSKNQFQTRNEFIDLDWLWFEIGHCNDLKKFEWLLTNQTLNLMSGLMWHLKLKQMPLLSLRKSSNLQLKKRLNFSLNSESNIWTLFLMRKFYISETLLLLFTQLEKR